MINYNLKYINHSLTIATKIIYIFKLIIDHSIYIYGCITYRTYI